MQNVAAHNLKIRRTFPVFQSAKFNTDILRRDLFVCMIVVVVDKIAFNLLKVLSCSLSEPAQSDE